MAGHCLWPRNKEQPNRLYHEKNYFFSTDRRGTCFLRCKQIPRFFGKANITIHTVIFDGERGNIAFYRQTPLKEKSPTDPEVLAGEFSQVFEGYLYPKR
ncbi:hypothetical protein DN748_13885 [Sinomicrobium soli]|nr:hypothetical protein DN748_13885 [Sinomicrobium sp. N-1-3-6]